MRLVDALDKGFPYDDGDNTISDAAPLYSKADEPIQSTLIGKLNGENVTAEELKALVDDTEVPLTMELVELKSDISDKPASEKVLAPSLKKSEKKTEQLSQK